MKTLKSYLLLSTLVLIISCTTEEQTVHPSPTPTPTTKTPKPIADFSYSNSEYSPRRVEFTNNSSKYNYAKWDFGNGDTSIKDEPYTYYEKAGTYSVTLIVKGDGGSDTITKDVISPVVNGMAVFYTVQEASVDNPIKVTIGNITKNINGKNFYVDCDNPSSYNNVVVFDLPPGVYKMTATQGSDSWSDSIEVEESTCTFKQL